MLLQVPVRKEIVNHPSAKSNIQRNKMSEYSCTYFDSNIYTLPQFFSFADKIKK